MNCILLCVLSAFSLLVSLVSSAHISQLFKSDGVKTKTKEITRSVNGGAQ